MVNVVDMTIPAGVLGEKISICLIQLQSPFPNEMVVINEAEYPRFEWLPEALENRRTRIKTLLGSIKGLQRHIDILIFPEYSISMDSLEDIKTFAKENKTITIVNYYNTATRRSVTSTIFPSGKNFDQSKITRSLYDTNVLTEIPDPDKSLNRFYWSIIDNNIEKKAFIQLFTCKDFLNYWSEVIERKHAGIVLVPMCSPSIEEFVAAGRLLLRAEDIKGRDGSIITILGNAAGIVGYKGKNTACGSSQILAPSRSALPVLSLKEEQGIIIDVRPFNVLKVPSTTREGEVTESSVVFSILKDGRIDWKDKTIGSEREILVS